MANNYDAWCCDGDDGGNVPVGQRNDVVFAVVVFIHVIVVANQTAIIIDDVVVVMAYNIGQVSAFAVAVVDFGHYDETNAVDANNDDDDET